MEGGGYFYIQKKELCVTFLYAKKCTLRYVLYTKILTLCVKILYAKKNALLVTFIYIPGGFARVASPKMMLDCHMLRMNVCDAGRHAGTQSHEKGLTFIRVGAWLAHARATGAGQTASFGTPTGL